MTSQLLVGNALTVFAMMTCVWLASVKLRDASVVDPWWSMLFLALTSRTAWTTGLDARKAMLLAVVSVWALRLFAHLTLRSRGKPEDPRYAAFRRRFGEARYWWVSFFQVFVLQGTLALLISAPLQYAASRPVGEPFHWVDALGFVLFAVGFAFEAIADRQLQRFRDDPDMRGKVLDRGLFAWTRHPNYFGDAVLWWGFGCFAATSLAGLATLLGPALMTYLLVRVSGVTMLDAHLTKTRPGYAEYLSRTSAFLPRRPTSSGRTAAR
jgi:steroid 5-alpha reductase family enzyme